MWGSRHDGIAVRHDAVDAADGVEHAVGEAPRVAASVARRRRGRARRPPHRTPGSPGRSRTRPAVLAPGRCPRATAATAARAGRAVPRGRAARRTCGALTDSKSAPSAPKSTGTWPTACAASTCTSTPRSRHAATTSATGCTVPTSWLAHWTCTSAVSGRTAPRTVSGSTRPRPSTPTIVTSPPPRAAAASLTAECSTAGTTWWAPARPRPHRGGDRLGAPLVNTTSRGRAPSHAAASSRAFSTATRAAMPSMWMRPGSPVPSSPRSAAVKAATTSGRGGEVDVWSR